MLCFCSMMKTTFKEHKNLRTFYLFEATLLSRTSGYFPDFRDSFLVLTTLDHLSTLQVLKRLQSLLVSNILTTEFPTSYAIQRIWTVDSAFTAKNGQSDVSPFSPFLLATPASEVKKSPDFFSFRGMPDGRNTKRSDNSLGDFEPSKRRKNRVGDRKNDRKWDVADRDSVA